MDESSREKKKEYNNERTGHFQFRFNNASTRVKQKEKNQQHEKMRQQRKSDRECREKKARVNNMYRSPR